MVLFRAIVPSPGEFEVPDGEERKGASKDTRLSVVRLVGGNRGGYTPLGGERRRVDRERREGAVK